MRTMSNNLELKNTKVINTLREKYPNTELFMVRIFLYLECIWRFTVQIFTVRFTLRFQS